MEKMFVCTVCGHIEFGSAPDICPVCFSPREKFNEDAEAVHPASKEGKEKHVPVITAYDHCGLMPGICRDIQIKVGSVPHPMQSDHWIQWIDVYLDKKLQARYQIYSANLQAAVGVHLKSDQHGTLTVIEHCNIHGSWMAEIKV
ncbi:MAG: desulfoferrodoxin family protein [candidate division FCPU426 bacterium]